MLKYFKLDNHKDDVWIQFTHVMTFTTSVRPRKHIDYKKLNEGDQLPFVSSKVRVSRVLKGTFLVQRRRQSPNIVSNIYLISFRLRDKRRYTFSVLNLMKFSRHFPSNHRAIYLFLIVEYKKKCAHTVG